MSEAEGPKDQPDQQNKSAIAWMERGEGTAAGFPAPVIRERHGRSEAQRDGDVLRFIGRFRFVTDALLAERFGVSRQQMNLRLRRLDAAGLVERTKAPTEPRLTMLTRNGARAVDLPPRRAARTDAQRDHELALVWLVIQLERAGGALVRTERECRTLEAADAGRYSVTVTRPGRPEERRWPDVVLDGNGRRSALELELSAKGTTRLQAIVDAYAAAPWFDEILFLAASVSIAKRLARAVAEAPRPLALYAGSVTDAKLRVVPWPALSADEQRAVAGVTPARCG
jgi:DNA-binding Lrp family transcriptional regulator